MNSIWRPAAALILALILLTGVAYPLTMTALAQIAFPAAANGSLIRSGNQIIGSRLIGQAFSGDTYFWPRPSAAGAGYDAAASSGANLGPTSQKLVDRVKADLAHYRGTAARQPIPADAVTASGSGLDPHISPANARLQAGRVAQARGLPLARVEQLVNTHITNPTFGFLGAARVNVLDLNLSLDRLAAGNPAGTN